MLAHAQPTQGKSLSFTAGRGRRFMYATRAAFGQRQQIHPLRCCSSAKQRPRAAKVALQVQPCRHEKGMLWPGPCQLSAQRFQKQPSRCPHAKLSSPFLSLLPTLSGCTGPHLVPPHSSSCGPPWRWCQSGPPPWPLHPTYFLHTPAPAAPRALPEAVRQGWQAAHDRGGSKVEGCRAGGSAGCEIKHASPLLCKAIRQHKGFCYALG